MARGSGRDGGGGGGAETGHGAGWTPQKATATVLDRPGPPRVKPRYLQTSIILLPLCPNCLLPSGQSFSSGLWGRQGGHSCAGSKPSQTDRAICGESTEPNSQGGEVPRLCTLTLLGRDQRRGLFPWMDLASLTPWLLTAPGRTSKGTLLSIYSLTGRAASVSVSNSSPWKSAGMYQVVDTLLIE